ncbi:MAG: hypothetical protein OXU70_17525 [Gammaproteobacteria bacterium]|nr:hypothetical protein [Gammaproteobacteria bacterium]
MNLAKAQHLLWEELYKLRASGGAGFEGFVAAALSELTTQPFHVVKSGPQGGSDVRSDPCNLVKVNLEAKRYGQQTRLSLGQLLVKVTEASKADLPPDLWILASTRAIDVSDREQLYAHGESLGIGIIVWDWKGDQSGLGDMAAVCAAAQQACQRHLNSRVEVQQALELIRNCGEFESKVSMWRLQLVSPAVGYASCRERCWQWLDEGQASLGDAKSRLGGHHHLKDGASSVVRRSAISQQLNVWFEDRKGTMAALVGDEGTGKSWATLAWCDEARNSVDFAPPLVVYLRATTIHSVDARADIAQALSDQTGIRSTEFWRRRLKLWERSGRESVRVVVIVDGLNQNFLFHNWSDWAQPLLESRLDGMYKLIASCWTNRWRDDLYSLASLEPEPLEIAVEGFNDAELEELLASMSANRDALTESVLKLMRSPRLAAIALDHHEALAESGDVTADRVIYEDWKDRVRRHGPMVGMDDARMKEFVADLGRKLREDLGSAVSRHNILDILSHKSGRTGEELQVAVAQLTSGGWFTDGDTPDTFKLNADRVHYVLGAALLANLKLDPSSDVAGKIAEFLDPLKGHSRGSDILRAATTIALVEEGAGHSLRRELLWRWLDEQNFSSKDFEDLWRLTGLDPDLFLDTAEREWLGSRVNGSKDEVLVKMLANGAEFPAFNLALKAKLVDWLGTAWPEPVSDPVGQDRDGNGASGAGRGGVADLRSRCEDWLHCVERRGFAPVRYKVESEWNWLSQRAVAVVSYLARAPYVQAIEAWALSRALMQVPHGLDDLAWVIRMNSQDPGEADEALAQVISRFEQKGHETARKAASYLRGAMSNVARESEVGRIDDKWGSDSAHGRSDSPVDGPDKDLLETVADQLAPGGWKQVDPIAGAELIDALIERGLPPGGREIDLMLKNFRDVVTIISLKSRELLADAFDRESAATANGSDAKRVERLGSCALLLRLYDAPAGEQSRMLLSASDVSIGEEWWCICRVPGSTELADLDFSFASKQGLVLWLDCVAPCLGEEAVRQLEIIPELATHEDREIRRRALFVASEGPHFDALKQFAESVYASPISGDTHADRLDDFARSIALLKLEAVYPGTAPEGWQTPEGSALRVKWVDKSDVALDAFAPFLADELEAIAAATSWSSRRYWYSGYLKCVKLLVERGRDPVEEWLARWAKSPGRGAYKALMNSFPVLDTMRALKDKAPDVVLSALNAIEEGASHSIHSKDPLNEIPFEMKRSEASDAVCDEILSSAITDEALLGIAFYCYKHHRVDWLMEQIDDFEARSHPADLAKAMTLLGFCDQSAEADERWRILELNPPKDPWIRRVYESSTEDYRRNRRARAAFQEFWKTDLDERQARHAWKRLEENCDRRLGVWFHDVEPTGDVPHARSLARNLGTKGH